MKRLSALLIAVIIIAAGLFCPVFAVGPQPAVITSNGPYNYKDVGEEVYLWVDAESKDGGTLTYQWYSTTVNDISTIRAVEGATSKEYSFKAIKGGITYYCCGVWNNVDGVQSQPVYSNLIRVWVSPVPPVIDSTGPDVHMKVGSETGVWCHATTEDVYGTLTYQWYKTNVNDITTIKAITDANSSDLDLKQDYAEVAYYCCGVWNTINGKQSDPVYSRLIRVEFFDPEPAVPVITATVPDCHLETGREVPLWVDAETTDGGTLTYQWYSTTVNDISTIKAIVGAEGKEHKFTDNNTGVTYYCCGVWNNRDGQQSAPAYSRLIKVEIFSNEPEPPEVETVQAIEITEMPDKLEYKDGEALDLKGLKVRVLTNLGFFDLNDGEKLTVTQPDYNNPGTQIIIVSYEGVSDTFEITVKAKEVPQPDPTPDPNQNTTPDPNQNTTPDPNQNTTPDPNQNTTPDPNQNTQPDPNQNAQPDPGKNTDPVDPNKGGEKKSASYLPYVCAAAGVIVGGAAVFFITRKKK